VLEKVLGRGIFERTGRVKRKFESFLLLGVYDIMD